MIEMHRDEATLEHERMISRSMGQCYSTAWIQMIDSVSVPSSLPE